MIKLKTAVIGLGNMGRHHVRHLASLPQSDLVAVCDNSQERADEFATTYNCKAYTDIDTLLSSETLDAVCLTAPTSIHYILGKKILSHGVSLLIEKPISETCEEADELIALAKQKGVTLMIGHIERFNPAVIAVKHFIDEGKLGAITSIISRRVNVFPKQMKDANVAIDLGVHDIDLVSYLIGESPVSLSSSSGSALIDSREDFLDIFLMFPSASAYVQVNWITPIPIRQASITGTKGYLELDYMRKTATFFPSTYEKTVDASGAESVQFSPEEPQSLPVEEADALASELTHFLDCVASKRSPKTTGEMGKTALLWSLKSLEK